MFSRYKILCRVGTSNNYCHFLFEPDSGFEPLLFVTLVLVDVCVARHQLLL